MLPAPVSARRRLPSGVPDITTPAAAPVGGRRSRVAGCRHLRRPAERTLSHRWWSGGSGSRCSVLIRAHGNLQALMRDARTHVGRARAQESCSGLYGHSGWQASTFGDSRVASAQRMMKSHLVRRVLEYERPVGPPRLFCLRLRCCTLQNRKPAASNLSQRIVR